MTDGRLVDWCEPIRKHDEFWLEATVEHISESRASGQVEEFDGSGAFVRWGPFTPVAGREVVQRSAINREALDHFRSMLGDEETADVVFVVAGERILAHRSILSARCETMRAMFSSGLAESHSAWGEREMHTVNVGEVAPNVFRYMIEYIYAGDVEVDPKDAMDLLALADQYMLDGLKLLCGFALKRTISVETVSRIIQAADRYDCVGSELKAECLSFILSNYEKVVQSTYFQELEASPHLLLQIHRAIAPNLKAQRGQSAVANSPVAHNTRKRARDSAGGRS